jgi:ketosteroid isomerase-like protein
MDLAARVFLESPVALGLFSFLLFALVLMTRNRWPESSRRYSLPVVLGAIPMLFAIQKLVVTEREMIHHRLNELIAAVERSDVEAFAETLHPDYRADGMDRAAMTDFVTASLKELRLYDTRLHVRRVTVDGDQAELTLTASTTVSRHGEVGQRHTGVWQLIWRREAGTWRVVALRPLSINLVPVDSLRTLRGAVP